MTQDETQADSGPTESAISEFGDRIYSLADFAKAGVQVEHPLTQRRIPVVTDHHGLFRFHTELVVGGPDYMDRKYDGLEPEPFEVEQLCADLEYRMRYYGDGHRARVVARGPFDVDSTVNTHTFRKHPEHGWQYRASSWTRGPMWFPTSPWSKVGPFTLAELLDHVHTIGDGPPMPRWVEVKAESGAFPSESAECAQVLRAARWVRGACEKCCECTDDHHEQRAAYGTEDDVHISRDAAAALADWLDLAAADLANQGPLCGCGTGCDACEDNLWEQHARAALALSVLIAPPA